ncbi:MAG: type II toxin-antitoxin system VapC family toxin [Candidatus Pacebacteria bacterium]|nr:type II toxin-antitoxin system VapC family toxin [Candidatus Paceibacterota bacterium]
METRLLEKKIKSLSKIFLDTAIFIYFLEENSKWINLVLPIFQLAEKKEVNLVTSSITALEVITGYKKQKRQDLVKSFWEMLEDFEIEILDFEKKYVEKAAQLRADLNLRTPDAIQLSLAIKNKISAFATNDAKLKKVKEIKIFYLGDYVK